MEKNPEGKFPVLEGFQDILSTVMVKMFFGADLKGRQINGENVPNFVSNLVADGANASFDITTLLFGKEFASLGLRAKDRDINRRLKIFKEFAMVLVKEKIEELKSSGFKAGDKKNGNLIEELYLANSLSGTGSEDVLDFGELIDEFCGFFFAGTDTT